MAGVPTRRSPCTGSRTSTSAEIAAGATFSGSISSRRHLSSNLTAPSQIFRFKRHERWAWYALWMLPLQWLSQFAFFPDLTYLALAVLTPIGCILPYGRFFPREKPARVE